MDFSIKNDTAGYVNNLFSRLIFFTEYVIIIKKVNRRNIMAYFISSDCIACGACVSDCPTDAISEKGGKYEIDAEKCIDCGSCQGTCPVDAPQSA